MTELSTEPVVHEAAPTPPVPSPDTASNGPAPSEVDHNEGGWPVVPLALSGANTTVSMVAAAGLAGGPIAAMVAATGAAVLGTVATYRSRNPRPRQAARRAAARNASRAASRTGSGRGTAGGSRGSGRAGGAGRVPNQKRGASGAGRGAAGGSKGRHGAGKGQGPASLNKSAGLQNGRGAGGLLGKTSQVKALRKAQKEAGGSRGDKRAQTTAARRAIADARRNAKHSPKSPGKGAGLGKGKGKGRGSGGLAGRFLGGAGRKARAVRDAAIAKNRARRDAKAAGKVAGQRSAVRKAPARKAARQALRRSLARFQGRRLLAALLALPIGLLGLITSPIGRKLNIPWLIHPGRRLYRRLVGIAREQRAERDEAIRDELADQEAAADAEAAQDGSEGLADNVLRPTGPVPSNTNTTVSEGENVSGFRFEEAASEMEQAANAYDPENAMEILAMVEGLPAALTSVANVMKILAERSDSEFPLEKEVAAGFSDIFGALMSAVAVAEDMGPLFRNVHAQDIARHEDPRNGPQAEKGWNV